VKTALIAAVLALFATAANAQLLKDIPEPTGVTPFGRVFVAYKRFAFLQFCNQAQYWISGDEIRRGRDVVKAVVAKAQEEDSTIDTDAVWKDARNSIAGLHANYYVCEDYKNKLYSMSFDTAYPITKP